MTAAANLVPVRAGHGFDPAALAAWLSAALADPTGPLTVLQFQGGQSNPTFLVETAAGRRLVVRKKPPGVLLPSAHAIEREFAILRALHGTPVPVPAPLALCEDAGVIGTPFYVMDFVAGDLHDQPHMPGVSPTVRRAAYDDLARTLAALHAVDWAGRGLGGLAKTGDFLGRQIARWDRQFRAANGDAPDADMDWLGCWLRDRQPADAPPVLVHGDYRLGNLLFAPGQGRVAAILDWELTTLGDPLSDLAYACLPYHLPSGEAGVRGMADQDLLALGIPAEVDLVAAYCAYAGRPPVADWTFYLVFSLYRLAAIARGIHARALAGNASSADALIFGAQTRQLIAAALTLARS